MWGTNVSVVKFLLHSSTAKYQSHHWRARLDSRNNVHAVKLYYKPHRGSHSPASMRGTCFWAENEWPECESWAIGRSLHHARKNGPGLFCPLCPISHGSWWSGKQNDEGVSERWTNSVNLDQGAASCLSGACNGKITKAQYPHLTTSTQRASYTIKNLRWDKLTKIFYIP